MTISSIWKRDFPFFGLVMGTSGKQCQYLLFKNGISVVLFGLWWQPLGNNINIFYLKTGFPLFFLACDGNLWKIISISSIWKRNFRVFLGLWREPHLKTGFPCLFGLFWKIMPISSIWKRDFPFLGLWWQPLENNANIFYLKTEFRVFFLGLWWGTSFENGISVSFWAFLENNANIFYLKTGFPFFWACDGNLWKIMPISSIWKRKISVFFSGLVMGTSFENGISLFLGL